MARKIKGDIVTHTNPDLDAAFAAAIVEGYAPGYKGAKFKFVPKDYKVPSAPIDDIVVDIVGGIKGDLDADGTRHSAAMAVARMFMPARHQEAIRHLLETIDAEDSYGFDGVERMYPELAGDLDRCERIQEGSIVGEWRRQNAVSPMSNHRRIKWAQWQLESHLFVGLRLLDTIDSLPNDRRCQLLGEVAILNELGGGDVVSALRRLGIKAYVFIDGTRLGVTSLTNKLRLDGPEILAIIQAAGEDIEENGGEWFRHSSGFMVTNGSRGTTVPSTHSKVLAHQLVMAVLDLLAKVA